MDTAVMGTGMAVMGTGTAITVTGMAVMLTGMVDTGAVMDGAVGGVQASASMSAATDAAAGTRTMAIIPAAIAGATSLHKRYGWYGTGTSPQPGTVVRYGTGFFRTRTSYPPGGPLGYVPTVAIGMDQLPIPDRPAGIEEVSLLAYYHLPLEAAASIP
jgi:hypothetical protein